jgi:nucleotide-binding universal stress UspA family protein
MNHPQEQERVVVGIDGSNAAINAARWAVAEATSRDIPLRLVHAIPHRQPDAPAGDESLDIEYGETALRGASARLHAMGEQVKIEAELVHGSPKIVLIDESRYAAMICVGSIGIGQVARRVLGSTADSVARYSHCPVGHSQQPRNSGVTFRMDCCRGRRLTRQRRGARVRFQGSATS